MTTDDEQLHRSRTGGRVMVRAALRIRVASVVLGVG